MRHYPANHELYDTVNWFCMTTRVYLEMIQDPKLLAEIEPDPAKRVDQRELLKMALKSAREATDTMPRFAAALTARGFFHKKVDPSA